MSRTPQIPKVCAVDGCDVKVEARGWCRRHYDRWRHGGSADGGRTYNRNKGQTCAVDDCDAPAASRGWCRLHYDRWKRNGDPTIRLGQGRRTDLDDAESPNVLTGQWVLNPRTRVLEHHPA